MPSPRTAPPDRTPSLTYSVVDVETTGLSPGSGDRIVEIGVARLDADGNIVDAFDTLVNPDGPVRATRIHGINNAMVSDAPRFGDIIERLCAVLDGSVLAAHNAGFDMGFLREEFRRAGTPFPRLKPVCTLVLARRHLNRLPSKSLEACRRYLGIADEGAHSALADARAAAGVLRHIIETSGPPERPDLFTSPIEPVRAQPGLFDDSPVPLKPRTPEEATV